MIQLEKRTSGLVPSDLYFNGQKIYLDVDQDSYLYAPSDDVLALILGGSVKATFNATGLRVGDATAPTVSLEAANGLTVAAGYLNVSGASGIRTTLIELSADPNLGAEYYIARFKSSLPQQAHNGTLFDAAGLTDSVTLFTLPANARLIGIAMQLSTQFVAAGLTDLGVTVGLAGDQSGFLNPAAMNMVTDATNTRYDDVGGYYAAFMEGVHGATRTAIPIIAYATAVGANLNTTTAGYLRFFISYIDTN